MSELNSLFAFMKSLKSIINRVIWGLIPLFCWLLFFILGFPYGMRASIIVNNAGYSDVFWNGVVLLGTVGGIIMLGPKIFPQGIHKIWSEKPVTLIGKLRYLAGAIGIGASSGLAVHAFLSLANNVLHFWSIK